VDIAFCVIRAKVVQSGFMEIQTFGFP